MHAFIVPVKPVFQHYYGARSKHNMVRFSLENGHGQAGLPFGLMRVKLHAQTRDRGFIPIRVSGTFGAWRVCVRP